MKYRQRIYYTESQKALMWDRWQKGDSLHAITRLFDRGHSSVQRIRGETGGAPPSISSMTGCILSLVCARFIGERLIEPPLCWYFAEATVRLSLRIFTSAYER